MACSDRSFAFRLVLGLALLAMLALAVFTTPSSARAAGVVGTGSPNTCTDTALNTALTGGGLVTFNCGGGAVTIDISTGTGTKAIAADTTIDGGSLITISGGNSVGVFSVNTGVNFTVQNLTIANGSAGTNTGGAISNNGTLTVSNSTFSGNSAAWDGGGIYNNGGMLTVTNSTFSGNSAGGGAGGGIDNEGTAMVTASTFSGNSAPFGGGIYNDSTLTVTNSTFSSNSATAGGNGGGIYTNGPLAVTNSTFSGNSAPDEGGAIDNNVGTVTVTNSTFSGNSAGSGGGGIFNGGGGPLTVTNTILVNSTSGGNCAGVTDGGHNIDDGTTCGFTGAGCTTTSGSSFCNTNPVLDPTGLQNNGGPTQTIALCTGTGAPRAGCTGASPAINAGDESVCATTSGTAPVDNLDQRGFVRPGTGAANCSIGAFEANSPCVVGAGTGASCTEAALDACLPGGANFDGTVTFNCGGAATIIVTSTKTISADTTIDGGSLITISGGNSVGVFVNPGVNFTVQNLTIANGNNSANLGGGIVNGFPGALTVTNSTFSDNSAFGAGGIFNSGGTVTVTNSTFSGNSATGASGGGIFNYGGTVTVTNSTFSGNSATGTNGGDIYNGGGTVTVTNTIVANSTSGGNCAGSSITDGGHNIDDGTTCGFTGTGCTNTSGSSCCNTSPVLDPTGLQNNGGPTQTIALCTGTGAPRAGCTGASPAIDAGDESVCSTTTGTAPVDNLDQRGFVRPGAGATNCSIGAFEASAAPDGTSCTSGSQCRSGACTAGGVCAEPTPTPTPTATNTPPPPPTATPTATPTPVTIPLSLVELRASRRASSSTLRLQTVFDASPLGNVGQLLSDGATVTVSGAGLQATETMVFPGYFCFNLGHVIQCIGTLGEVANFKTHPSSTLLTVKITAQGRSFSPPLTTAGVAVDLSLVGYRLDGQIGSCTVRGRGTVARCPK